MKPTSIRIPEEMQKSVKKHCDDAEITYSHLITLAVSQYLKNNDDERQAITKFNQICVELDEKMREMDESKARTELLMKNKISNLKDNLETLKKDYELNRKKAERRKEQATKVKDFMERYPDVEALMLSANPQNYIEAWGIVEKKFPELYEEFQTLPSSSLKEHVVGGKK